MRPTAGLGLSIIVLLWVELAAILAQVAASIYEQRVVDDFLNSARWERPAPNSIDRADILVNVTVAFTLLIGLATVILLALWSNRVSHNAQNRGVPGLRPGLAAGGWFIPFAGAVIPFIQLRRAAKPFLGTTTSLTAWQVLIVSAALVSRLGGRAIEHAASASILSDALAQRVYFLSVAAVLFAVATMFAMRAIKEIDRRVSATA